MFLEQYAVIISLVVAGIVLVVFLLLVLFTKQPKTKEASHNENELITALGGKENINEITMRGSRVSVVLADQTKVNNEQLKKHGVSRVIVMQDKLVLLVETAMKEKLQKLL